MTGKLRAVTHYTRGMGCNKTSYISLPTKFQQTQRHIPSNTVL